MYNNVCDYWYCRESIKAGIRQGWTQKSWKIEYRYHIIIIKQRADYIDDNSR